MDIDSLPDLNWEDGTQSMTLKCIKHHKSYLPEPKHKVKKNKKKGGDKNN
jgi:hypothetical protein